MTTYLVFAVPSDLTGLAALGTLVVTYFLWDLAVTAVHVPSTSIGYRLDLRQAGQLPVEGERMW